MESRRTHKLQVEGPDHIGIVVKDIDKAKETWSSMFGIGPWDSEIWDGTDAEGRPFKARLAHAQLGTVRIELIQTLEGRSVYSSFSDIIGEGLHHISFYVDDVEAEVANLVAQGAKVLEKGTGEYAYLEKSGLGIIFELLKTGLT